MDVLSMGDHGVYVWSVYAIGLILLSVIGAHPLIALRRLKRQHSEDEERT